MRNFGLENSIYFAGIKNLGINPISINDKIFLMNDIRGYS